MASKEAFEDHCWKDVISTADMKLYSPYARETFVGPSVAFLAIDLYNLVYRGGPGAPVDLDPQYPNSCGIYAHRAIEPTKRLFAAVRRAGIPVFYCTQDHRPQNRPDGAISTRRKEKPANAADHGIYHEFAPEPPTSSSTSSAPASSRERRSCRTSISSAFAVSLSAARARQAASAPARWTPIRTDFTCRSSRNAHSTDRN